MLFQLKFDKKPQDFFLASHDNPKRALGTNLGFAKRFEGVLKPPPGLKVRPASLPTMLTQWKFYYFKNSPYKCFDLLCGSSMGPSLSNGNLPCSPKLHWPLPDRPFRSGSSVAAQRCLVSAKNQTKAPSHQGLWDDGDGAESLCSYSWSLALSLC